MSQEPLADAAGRRAVAAQELIHSGPVFDVVRDEIDFAPGVRFSREYMRHPGAAAVLALDDDQRVLMIRQYRHAVAHELWEIPAGLLDVEGEDPAQAALRELVEETGRAAGSIEPLLVLRPSPGMDDEVIHVFLAREITTAPQAEEYERLDEEAEIETRWVPLDEAVDAVLQGRISNATTVSALLAVHARLS